jgi:uncharacterized protein DUF2510
MTTSIQPGWYDDPEDSNGQRYWDGQAWTPQRHRKPLSGQSSAPNLPPPQPVAQASSAAYPPPPDQKTPFLRSRTWRWISGVLTVLFVLSFAARVGHGHFGKSAPRSPEDQIKAIVQAEFDEVNASNFAYDPKLQCKAIAGTDPKEVEQNREDQQKGGKLSVGSVANIHVTGDHATADVTENWEKAPAQTDNWQFVNEDGSWKECNPPTPANGDQGNGDGGN